MNKILYIISVYALIMVAACSDDDTFSTSKANLLTMSQDTVRFDTVFSRTPTSAKYFWIFNNTNDGIRCSNIRLDRGNQSGFRVNIDGVYLGKESGYKTTNVEIRKGDSIRVFVELTSPYNYSDDLQYRYDNIVFTLESGVTQTVNLNAWSWDADTVHTMRITNKYEINTTTTRPLIVYDSIVVEPNAKLTIAKGSTVYFHDNAGIDVHGTLLCEGDSTANITLRGYRLDNMFDYLPYDMLPGHWQGIRIHPESYDNKINYTDLHSAYNGIVCDSSDVSKSKLILENSIIHNCQGYGLFTVGNQIDVKNCQITNTLHDCVAVYGGNVNLLNCTIGQFYPFDASRGSALFFTNLYNGNPAPLTLLSVINSLITGYADDVMTGIPADESLNVAFNYQLSYSLIRTPEIDDEEHCKNMMWENSDSVNGGTKHFVKIDTDNMRYDFHLDSISVARGAGNPELMYPTTRDGLIRDKEHPDLGCY